MTYYFDALTTTKEKIAENFLAIISSNPNSDEMKVTELINDIMAEKEVSEEKDSLISYEGSYF